MRAIIFIIFLTFISLNGFAASDFTLTSVSVQTQAAEQTVYASDPNNITIINGYKSKTLKVITPIIFPDRKDLSEVSQVINGKSFYWLVAVMLQEGTYQDVKDVKYDPQAISCTFSFDLSSHKGYASPYILKEGETLTISHVIKTQNQINAIYYIRFIKSDESRLTLWCRSPLDHQYSLDDFKETINGILQLEIE